MTARGRDGGNTSSRRHQIRLRDFAFLLSWDRTPDQAAEQMGVTNRTRDRWCAEIRALDPATLGDPADQAMFTAARTVIARRAWTACGREAIPAEPPRRTNGRPGPLTRPDLYAYGRSRPPLPGMSGPGGRI